MSKISPKVIAAISLVWISTTSLDALVIQHFSLSDAATSDIIATVEITSRTDVIVEGNDDGEICTHVYTYETKTVLKGDATVSEFSLSDDTLLEIGSKVLLFSNYVSDAQNGENLTSIEGLLNENDVARYACEMKASNYYARPEFVISFAEDVSASHGGEWLRSDTFEKLYLLRASTENTFADKRFWSTWLKKNKDGYIEPFMVLEDENGSISFQGEEFYVPWLGIEERINARLP